MKAADRLAGHKRSSSIESLIARRRSRSNSSKLRPVMSATPVPPEDQARLLEDALIAVRQQTALMRKCLDTPGKLMDALKCW